VKNIIKTFKIDKYSVRSVLSLYRCIPFRSNWGCFPIRRSMWARSRALCPSSSISVPPTGSSCQFISYCFLTSPVSLAVGLSPMQMDSPVCYGLVKQLTAGPPWLWVGRCYSSSGVARATCRCMVVAFHSYGGGFPPEEQCAGENIRRGFGRLISVSGLPSNSTAIIYAINDWLLISFDHAHPPTHPSRSGLGDSGAHTSHSSLDCFLPKRYPNCVLSIH
jgi:hypothetical protein